MKIGFENNKGVTFLGNAFFYIQLLHYFYKQYNF